MIKNTNLFENYVFLSFSLDSIHSYNYLIFNLFLITNYILIIIQIKYTKLFTELFLELNDIFFRNENIYIKMHLKISDNYNKIKSQKYFF